MLDLFRISLEPVLTERRGNEYNMFQPDITRGHNNYSNNNKGFQELQSEISLSNSKKQVNR